MTTLTEVQALLVSKIKGEATITSRLKDAAEIREIEWVGIPLSYPVIRVRVAEFERTNPDCDVFQVKANVLVFGEDASSKLCNTIGSLLYNFFDRKYISSPTIKSVVRVHAKQFGADYLPEDGLWKSEVSLIFQVT